VGVELFHTDRQTDMTKLIVTLQTSVKVPKNNTYVEVLVICLWLSISN